MKYTSLDNPSRISSELEGSKGPLSRLGGRISLFSKDLTLQLILYLDALIAERHVTRAAERAGIGQPAMSAALNRLRVIFSDPILVRTPKGMVLTERAEEISTHIRRVIDSLEAATSSGTKFEPSSTAANIRVASSEGVALLLIPPLMRKLRAEAPEIRLTVQPTDLRLLQQHLSEGAFHLAIGYVDNVPNDMHASLLYPQGLRVIASHDHPEVQGGISLDQYTSLPHVIWGGEPTPYPTLEVMVDAALTSRGVTRSVGVRVSSSLLSAAIVAGTDMIATVPERAAELARTQYGHQVLPLPFPTPDPNISMFWHQRMQNDPLHAWLRKTIRDVAEELRQVKP